MHIHKLFCPLYFEPYVIGSPCSLLVACVGNLHLCARCTTFWSRWQHTSFICKQSFIFRTKSTYAKFTGFIACDSTKIQQSCDSHQIIGIGVAYLLSLDTYVFQRFTVFHNVGLEKLPNITRNSNAGYSVKRGVFATRAMRTGNDELMFLSNLII